MDNDRKIALGNDSSAAGRTARLVLVGGIHERGPTFISNAEVGPGNRVNGYTYPAYLAARGLTDSQESRRAWRAGR